MDNVSLAADAIDAHLVEHGKSRLYLDDLRSIADKVKLDFFDDLRVALNAAVAQGAMDFFCHRAGEPDAPLPPEMVGEAFARAANDVLPCYVLSKHPREKKVVAALAREPRRTRKHEEGMRP